MAFIALGTNLGNRETNLAYALEHLATRVAVVNRSGIYETEPWGVKEQPWFLNMVASVDTDVSPTELLGFLKAIERDLGRTPGPRYGPREIDLDILLYDDLIMETDNLVIPHPKLAERLFVLVPLAEIAPDLIHPVLGVTIRELIERLPTDLTVRGYKPRVQ